MLRYSIEQLESLAGARADQMYGRAGRDGLDLRDEPRLILRHEIGLVQQDDRPRAAVPRGDQVALDAPRVEIMIQAADQEHDIDVRGDDLLLGDIARRLARELAAAGERGLDDRVAVSLGLHDGHPVADRRKRLARLGAMTQASAHPGEAFAGGGVDAIDVLVFERDARGLPLTLGMRGERRGERIVPPECPQPVWFHPVLSVPQ